MGVTQGALARIEEQKRLTEQLIRDPKFQLDGVVLTPSTDFLRTNNFIQQGANRMFIYDLDVERWRPLQADEFGRVILSPTETDGARVAIKDRNEMIVKIFDSTPIPAYTAAVHAPVDVTGFNKKTLLVETNGSTTVYFQFSHDGISWYDWNTTAGTDVTLACNTEKVAFAVDDYTKYIRLIVHNATAAVVTCTLTLLAVM